MAHDAFLSYSHTGDQRLARALERALQAFAKPWYKLRALDIFRDEGNLNLSAHLWSSIQQALDTSQFFLYLASPLAAQSPWIAREIAYWKAHRHKQRLIILLTDGDLRWDGRDFHEPTSTAIPTVLYDTFDDEPFYLDMRWTREAADLSLHNERFKNQIAQIVATIKDVALEDIVGDEAEQHRRTMRIRNAAIASLAALTLAAVAAAAVAFVQRSAALRSAEQARAFASQAESRRIDAETARGEATRAARLADERAEEAARQQTIAEQQEHAARVALAEASTQEAERLVASGSPEDALAPLARALRNDPDSLVARSWISDLALNERLWMPRPPFVHNGPVYMAAFSADGRRVITASDDGTARVWDATTGRPAGAPLKVHLRSDAVFSPDGRRVVTVYGRKEARLGTVGMTTSRITALQQAAAMKRISAFLADDTAEDDTRLLNTTSGQAIGPPLNHGEPGLAHVAAFSPDSQRFVTASDHAARVWDGNSAKPVSGTLALKYQVGWAAFFSSGSRLVTGGHNTVDVWETVSWQQLATLETPGDPIAVSSNGLIATTGEIGRNGNTASIWNTATGARIGKPVQHKKMLFSVAFSHDGRRLVTSSLDETSRVWDVGTGQPIGVALEHRGPVLSATFSPDGRHVATASDDGTARVWDASSGRPVGASLRHQGPVYAAAFSPDGRRVVTASFDGTARVWDYLGKGLDAPPFGNISVGQVAALSPDWRRILTKSEGEARIWDLATRQPIGAPLQYGSAMSVFSHDGRWIIAFSSSDDSIRVWDAATGQPRGPSIRHDYGAGVFVHPAMLSPDGRFIIATPETNAAYVRDVVTGLPVAGPLRHKNVITAAGFSPDGRRLVTASGDNTAQIWDALRGRPVGAPLKHAYPVRAAAFSPDGRLVVTASNDTTARLWEAHTGRPAGLPLEHEQPVTIAHFSPEGGRLVTVAVDVARIWDVTTSQPAGFPLRHDDVIIAAAFRRDGGRVVTTSNDRTVRVWNAATGRPLSAPLSHATYVVRADFSPDGTRVATNLGADDPRIWRVLLDLNSPERIALAADLAEILGDHQVTALGSVTPLNESERLERMRRLAGPSATAFSPIDTILGRFADARR